MHQLSGQLCGPIFVISKGRNATYGFHVTLGRYPKALANHRTFYILMANVGCVFHTRDLDSPGSKGIVLASEDKIII